jgi:hypothetical protein
VRVSRALINYYRQNLCFLKGKFSKPRIIFLVIFRRSSFKQRVFTPSFSTRHSVPCAFSCHEAVTKSFLLSSAPNSEQFFRQHERNKPQPLAEMALSFFEKVTVLKPYFKKIGVTCKKFSPLRSIMPLVFRATSHVCENIENLSCKNAARIRRLASRLLKPRHEDGLAGMDLVFGKLRQARRQLGCEDWPLARLGAVWVAKIILERHEAEQQNGFSDNPGKGRAAANRFHPGWRLCAPRGRPRVGAVRKI